MGQNQRKIIEVSYINHVLNKGKFCKHEKIGQDSTAH